MNHYPALRRLAHENTLAGREAARLLDVLDMARATGCSVDTAEDRLFDIELALLMDTGHATHSDT